VFLCEEAIARAELGAVRWVERFARGFGLATVVVEDRRSMRDTSRAF
jgi:hypothetical protein